MTPKTPSGRPALPYLLRRQIGPVVFLFAQTQIRSKHDLRAVVVLHTHKFQ